MGILRWVESIISFIKSESYDRVVDIILPLLFENRLLGPLLSKNKIIIGFLLQVIAYGLAEAQATFPEQVWIPPTLTIIGLILQALGISHRGVKERRRI